MLFWMSDRTHTNSHGNLHYLKILKLDLLTFSRPKSRRSCTWKYGTQCNHYLSEGPIVEIVSGDRSTPSLYLRCGSPAGVGGLKDAIHGLEQRRGRS